MDIWATGDGFAIGAFSRIKHNWNADGSMDVWSRETVYGVSVVTGNGQFIEAVDKKGNIITAGGDGRRFYVPLDGRRLTLRYKTLPDPGLSRAALNKARKSVTRYLVSDAPYSLDIPDTMPGVIEWMKQKLSEIPTKSRATASFRFDTRTEYGDTYPNIEISYEEPETDAEVIRRVQVEAERARIKEAEERNKLSILREKYPEIE